jgi:hypothetical protein
MIKTSYPALPTVPYQHTEVPMDQVIAYIETLNYVQSVKCAVYVIFRNEGANGTAGINNNYIGLQTDSNKWDDFTTSKIAGNVVKVENGTGRTRVFAAFATWKDSVDILAKKVIGRGLYVGGFSHPYANMKVLTEADFATAYYREWVTGDKKAIPGPAMVANLTVMYNQAMGHFK